MGYRHSAQSLMLAFALSIAACGGGGGGSGAASTPQCGTSEMNAKPCGPVVPVSPQPTITATKTELKALPATPATTTGNYDTIALQRTGTGQGAVLEQVAAPGAVRIQVDAATRTYTVLIDRAGLPAISTFRLDPAFGYHVVQTDTYSDGRQIVNEWDNTGSGAAGVEKPRVTTPPHVEGTSLSVSSGLSHVAMSYWYLDQLSVDASNNYTFEQNLAALFYVYGVRTDAADLPLSGSATYTVNNGGGTDLYAALSLSGGHSFSVNADFTLKADFGARTMSVAFNGIPAFYSDAECGCSGYYWGIAASGSVPFTDTGGFDIPVTGALNSVDPGIVEKSIPVTGNVNGAFFGPKAIEVGGTYLLRTADARFHLGGAYLGAQSP